MPGIYPRIVSKIFSQKAPVKPTSKKTPSGGRMIAKMIFKISIEVFYFLLIKGSISTEIYFVHGFHRDEYITELLFKKLRNKI